jgi:serine protease Do
MRNLSSLVLSLALPFGALAQAPPAPAPPPATPARLLAAAPGSSYLGIGIQEITAERAKVLKLRDAAGVEITRVGPGSPADRAGLKAGDVVLQYNGVKIEGIEQFARMVRETPVGREEKLDIVRDGTPQSVTVKIGQHPASPIFPEGFGFRLPDVPRVFEGVRSPMLGVEVETIDGQLAQYFGVTDGVLVRSVIKNSAAERAGFKAGDVILRVDDTKVGSAADITARLQAAHGRALSVALMRDHKETTLSVDVPEPRLGRAEPARLISPE